MARWLALLPPRCGWLKSRLINTLDMLAVLSDEADEEDDSGCGWLAGWAGSQTKNPLKRSISLSVAEPKVHQKNIQRTRRQAGAPAGRRHRCVFRSSYSSYSGPVQGRLAGRAIAAIK